MLVTLVPTDTELISDRFILLYDAGVRTPDISILFVVPSIRLNVVSPNIGSGVTGISDISAASTACVL